MPPAFTTHLVEIDSGVVELYLDLLEAAVRLWVLRVHEALTDDGHPPDRQVHLPQSRQAVHSVVQRLRHCLGNLSEDKEEMLSCGFLKVLTN